jgi:hypothetical protein
MYLDKILIKRMLKDNNIKKNIKPLHVVQKIKKNVKFSSIVKVILIPCREEYSNNYFNDLLWWKEEDYFIFKKNILSELNILTQCSF